MLKYKLYKVTHKTMLLNWKNWQNMHKQNFKMPIFINLINNINQIFLTNKIPAVYPVFYVTAI